MITLLRGLLLMLILCANSFIYGSACMPKAIAANTNFWITLDYQQALLCGDNFHIIEQADIPITITSPGLYCLAETIVSSATTDTPITVSHVTNVLIDLNNRGIIKDLPTDGTDRAMIYIEGSKNVGVGNGFLRTTTSASPSGDLISIWAQTSTSLLFDNVQCVGNLEEDTLSIGLYTDRCNSINANNYRVIDMATGFILQDTTNAILENCLATPVYTNGFVVTHTSNIITLVNCIAYSCTNAGFLIGTSPNDVIIDVIFDQCIASACNLDTTTTTNTTSGFSIQNAQAINGVTFRRCIAQDNHYNGFEQLGGTGIIMNECFANGNTFDGFQITGSDTEHVELRSCVAMGNGRNGIIAINGPVSSQIAINCIAANNITGTQIIGFSTLTTTSALISTGTGNYWYNYVEELP